MNGPRAFPLGDLTLDGGPVLTEATIGYQVWGQLDGAGGNAILLPGQFPGLGPSLTGLIGPGRVLDPGRYFIVSVDLFGDGLSSAPSQHLTDEARSGFAALCMVDNLRAQRRLIAALGVRRLRLVAGWSLAGAQALCWAAMYPASVDAVLALCATTARAGAQAETLAALLGMLEAPDPDREAPRAARLRAFGRHLAGQVHAAGYRERGLFRDDGFASGDQAEQAWEVAYIERDPADLAVMLRTWATADPGHLLAAATTRAELLEAIRARAILVACDTDQCCPPDQVAEEATLIPGAEARLIRSPFGHRAGAPGAYPEESAAIERALRDLLA